LIFFKIMSNYYLNLFEKTERVKIETQNKINTVTMSDPLKKLDQLNKLVRIVLKGMMPLFKFL